MKTNRTVGKLAFDRSYPYEVGKISNPSDAVLFNGRTLNGNGPHSSNDPNVEHVVACWNACEGINPEAVPLLLEALNAMLAARIDPMGITAAKADELARAAIAKASKL